MILRVPGEPDTPVFNALFIRFLLEARLDVEDFNPPHYLVPASIEP